MKTSSIYIECLECGEETELQTVTVCGEYEGDDYTEIEGEDEGCSCEHCGAELDLSGGGSSDYSDRMAERRQMGLSNF